MKKVGIIKRVFALLLIFLLSINSFAAVVSDNDGSAFITKAEFDSLKNNFQAQIDQYNQSIDAKIDGAIASYLSGIKLDEAKKYRVYGVPSNVDGTMASAVRVYGALRCFHSTGATDGYAALMDNPNMADPYGFGAGRYIKGIQYSSNWLLLDEGSAFFGAKWENYAYQPWYKTSKTQTTAVAIPGLSTGTDSKNNGNFVNGPISEVFQRRIYVLRPEFEIFEFLDAGEIRIKWLYAANGYKFDGGLRGGQSGEPAHGKNGNGALIHVKADGTESIIKLISDLPDQSTTLTKVWTSHTLTVAAGDQLWLKPKSSSVNWADSTGSNLYIVVAFGRDIPGWELETT